MRHTAEALGLLVMWWSNLEVEINDILMSMLRGHGLDRGVYYEIVGHIDFREKLNIIKSTAFTLTDDKEWFGELEGILSFIDNTLRPERNRMVHDPWVLDYQQKRKRMMIRFGTLPRLRKPQARKRILERDIVRVPPKEIIALCNQIADAATSLVSIMKKMPPPSSPQKSA